MAKKKKLALTPKPRPFMGCSGIRWLPSQHRNDAAKTAIEINPANAPRRRDLHSMANTLGVSVPQMIAAITSKYWGAGGVKLGVSFMEPTTPTLQNLIISHMNAWNQWANVTFAPSSSGEVRISRGSGGYWSYLGTDILHIPASEPTMNLEGFVLNTPVSEYKRVVRHETGHTLGFPHEHMRKEIIAQLDSNKTIAYFEADQGWSKQEVLDQVLTPLDDSTLMETPADVLSIMCYQLPGSITISGKPIPGGIDIDPTDGAFAAKLYPKASAPPVNPPQPGGNGGGANPPTTGSGFVTVDLGSKSVSIPSGWTTKQAG